MYFILYKSTMQKKSGLPAAAKNSRPGSTQNEMAQYRITFEFFCPVNQNKHVCWRPYLWLAPRAVVMEVAMALAKQAMIKKS